MLNSQLLLIGIALAMDAGIATFALGLADLDAPVSVRIRRGILVCLLFGMFQFLMTWIGGVGGYYFSFSKYGHLYRLVVSSVFFLIGMHFLQESFDQERKVLNWGIPSLLTLGFATSIDALAAGVTFGTMPGIEFIALEVGFITIAVCGLFFLLSQFLKSVPEQWLLRLAGVVFLLLGGSVIKEIL